MPRSGIGMRSQGPYSAAVLDASSRNWYEKPGTIFQPWRPDDQKRRPASSMQIQWLGWSLRGSEQYANSVTVDHFCVASLAITKRRPEMKNNDLGTWGLVFGMMYRLFQHFSQLGITFNFRFSLIYLENVLRSRERLFLRPSASASPTKKCGCK